MLEFVVVLVEPEHPHNVGFVARAMHCNALNDLRLVHKNSIQKVNDKSYRTAANSHDILDNAKVMHTFVDAIADCQCAIAFSRRVFGCPTKHFMLPEITKHLPLEGRIALVFGRESCGLSLDEVKACSYQCEIPVPGLMSLNLGQAVTASLYELCRSGVLSNGNGRARRPTHGVAETGKATIEQIESFKQFLERNLTGAYKDQEWREKFVSTMVQRLQPTRNELSAIYGLVRNLAKLPAKLEQKFLKK